MAPDRRRRAALLAALLVLLVLVAVVAYQFWPPSGGSTGPASAPGSRAASTPAAGVTRPSPPAPEPASINLDALKADRLRPGPAERNLFRFKAKPAPPPIQTPAPRPAGSPGPAVGGPPPPAPSPPIALKFIGLVEATEQSRRIAVLSDGRSVFHGSEGAIIDGRFRILRIGAESIEMAYLDGRGRQTIRLTGS